MSAVLAPTPAPVDQPEGGFEGGADIPGTIEAEKFDYGGPGVAYSDVDSVNSGGVSERSVSPNAQLASFLTVMFRPVDEALAYVLKTSSFFLKSIPWYSVQQYIHPDANTDRTLVGGTVDDEKLGLPSSSQKIFVV